MLQNKIALDPVEPLIHLQAEHKPSITRFFNKISYYKIVRALCLSIPCSNFEILISILIHFELLSWNQLRIEACVPCLIVMKFQIFYYIIFNRTFTKKQVNIYEWKKHCHKVPVNNWLIADLAFKMYYKFKKT